MSEKRSGFDPEAAGSPEKEANVVPVEQSPKPTGWQVETSSRQQSLRDFLATYFSTDHDRSGTDVGLHLSSGGGNVNFRDITGQVVRINVLYENGKVAQVHAELREQGREMGATDVYLTGKILDDYLDLEELKQTVNEQDREREQPMEAAAQEDIHTEKVIRQMEGSDLAHKDDGTDPVE